jgi:hypothetical protein
MGAGQRSRGPHAIAQELLVLLADQAGFTIRGNGARVPGYRVGVGGTHHQW